MATQLANAKLSEFFVVVQQLLDRSLICRPNDALSFSLTYFEDEKSGDPSVAHILHSLPYLLKRPIEFKDASCNLFCSVLQSSTILKPSSELFVTSSEVADLLVKYRDHENWVLLPFVDEVIFGLVEGRVIDFNVFTSILRLYTSFYTMITWVVGYLTCRFAESMGVSNSVAGDIVIGISEAIQFIKSQPYRENNSVLLSIVPTNYNFNEEDLQDIRSGLLKALESLQQSHSAVAVGIADCCKTIVLEKFLSKTLVV